MRISQLTVALRWVVCAPLPALAAPRGSLWAHSDASPFGSRRPDSRTQLATLLGDSMFEPVVSARALYAPPWRWAVGAADAFEQVGELVWPMQGGLVLMEAVKRLYATTARSQGRVLLAKAPPRARPETVRPVPVRKTGADESAIAE